MLASLFQENIVEVAKTFDHDGVRYRPGDPLPPNLDKQALEHYKRYGMVRDVKPSETKPAAPRQRKQAEPKASKPAAPSSTADGGQIELGQEQSQQSAQTDAEQQEQNDQQDQQPGAAEQDPAKD